jgi:hypothetical protein
LFDLRDQPVGNARQFGERPLRQSLVLSVLLEAVTDVDVHESGPSNRGHRCIWRDCLIS